MNFIENLEWRYATKKFDTHKKVSSADIETLKRAVQLSASSYGLQLYKVLIIENQAVKEQLKPASWNQNQITDASHLFVFCTIKNLSDKDIDNMVEITANTRNIVIENLKGYGDFIKGKLAEGTDDQKTTWLQKQSYIALGNLMMSSALMEIDTCAIEGFEPNKYNQILDLDGQNLSACVVCAVGYRHSEDKNQYQAKVRRPMEDLFQKI